MNETFFSENTQNMSSELAGLYRKWVPMVGQAIQEYFPRNPSREQLAMELDCEVSIDPNDLIVSVIDPTYLYIDRPGKLLRPVLTGLVLDAYGGNVEQFRSVMAMIEIMEVTTISLNDVWDNSQFRRGGPCTHVLLGRDVAHVAALAGYSYCQKFLFSNLLDVDASTRLRLYRAFAFEDMQFFLGDLVETLWPINRKEVIEEKHYFQEVISRCAFLSFRGPARIGAILGCAADDQIRLFEEFGMLIGLAYHLRGDNLNFSPQSETWGKTPYEDITAGRRSLVTSYAYMQASREDRVEMMAILNSCTTDPEKLNRFIDLMNKYGAPAYCDVRAREILSQAKEILYSANIPERHRHLLSEFADFMVERKK